MLAYCDMHAMMIILLQILIAVMSLLPKICKNYLPVKRIFRKVVLSKKYQYQHVTWMNQYFVAMLLFRLL